MVTKLNDSPELLLYLCPERRISFDGFVNYEGRRFGVSYAYVGKTARVMRNGSCFIFTPQIWPACSLPMK